MNRIEFIGNSLFIPFFLISVGMLADFSVILNGPAALIVAGTLTVVALFGKWVAALFAQLTFKYSNAQRQLIFGLSSAHAAATLAVILVGYKANILDENILNGTVILILVTCIVASFATEKAAKRIIIETELNSNESPQISGLYDEHILLPIANIENIEKLLEFAVLLKDEKSPNPISILSVVSNNTEAEINIMKARSKLEKLVQQASATETKVNVIATIDHNAASGIARIAREVMADIIVLGWPRRSGILDKLIGEKVDNILSNTAKTTFICHLDKPLIVLKRILVIVPPLAECEQGFELWVFKVKRLAQQLSISIQFYCNASTQEEIRKADKKLKTNAPFTFHFFDDWDDFLVLSRHLKEDDLFVLVSARKGSASFKGLLENLPAKMEKHFAHNSRLIIYPHQRNQNYGNENYEDISAESLQKGIDTAHKIRKSITSLFKK